MDWVIIVLISWVVLGVSTVCHLSKFLPTDRWYDYLLAFLLTPFMWLFAALCMTTGLNSQDRNIE